MKVHEAIHDDIPDVTYAGLHVTSAGLQVEQEIRRVATGDRAAFARLYDATAPAVYGLLVGMLRARDTADEVAQEVYLEIWQKASSFDPDRGSMIAWISLIARSRALDRIRSDRSYTGAVDRAESAIDPEEFMGASGSNPAELASIGERRRLVRRALGEMPEEQRAAVILAFFGGLSHTEIADREGLPLGTVKSRIRAGLARAEEHLRPLLGREA